ncbi:MAG: cytochrome c peroxidase [Crocinitomicaceae bacterium]|nr:cytochrome c peroxidase [Crocinitomicaceae bacterium]
MSTRFLLILGGIVTVSLFFSECKSSGGSVSPYPTIEHPTDNPTSEAKIELGRKLFFDTRLSKGDEIACVSCHRPDFAFTDRLPVAQGVEGRQTERNSPSLLNAGYLPTVMFDAHIETLEKQVIVPIQEHSEMDMNMKTLLAKLRAVPEYAKAAKEIFNRDFDAWVLTRSISAFQRSLVSLDSRFDQYYYQKDKSAMNDSEKRGWKVFSDKLYCTECHAPPMFTNYQPINNGIYSEYGEDKDKGRFRIHHDSTDIGKFKVPSLRNISLTYPYMHDGSMNDLEDVISHYSKGGNPHVNKDERIIPFTLTQEEQTDLLNFFEALTDTSYMKDFR